VLALVLADRDDVGLVQEDVRRLQHGVREEAGGDELLRLGLVLELGHPAQLAEARDRAEQPSGLGMRGDVALDEDRRALRVEADGEQQRGEREGRLAQVGRVVLDGDRVQVDDAEEGVAVLLHGDVLAHRADVVAEVLGSCGLDAGKNAHGRRLRGSMGLYGEDRAGGLWVRR